MNRTSVASRVQLNLRTSPQAKALIERAAALTGTSVSGFVLHNAYEAAHRVVTDHDQRVLLDRERAAFAAALDSVSEPPQASIDPMRPNTVA